MSGARCSQSEATQWWWCSKVDQMWGGNSQATVFNLLDGEKKTLKKWIQNTVDSALWSNTIVIAFPLGDVCNVGVCFLFKLNAILKTSWKAFDEVHLSRRDDSYGRKKAPLCPGWWLKLPVGPHRWTIKKLPITAQNIELSRMRESFTRCTVWNVEKSFWKTGTDEIYIKLENKFSLGN